MKDLNKKCKNLKGTWKSKWTIKGRLIRIWLVTGWTTKKINRKRGNVMGGELYHCSLRDKRARKASWHTSQAATKSMAMAMLRWSRMQCSTKARICSKGRIISGRWVTTNTIHTTTTAIIRGMWRAMGSSSHITINIRCDDDEKN